VKPEHLVQFALMGSVLAEVYLGMERPRVGLLNNGEERGKGRQLEKETYTLLEQAPLNFIGNVEGRDLITDKADVFVTDGFTGNIFLKTTEGAAQLVSGVVLEVISQLAPEVQSAVLPGLMEIKRRFDWETYGGAHLLGVEAVVVISHGSSSRVAIANAAQMAWEGARQDLVGQVASRIAAG
jgi:glycerol-3-phosphate acyltransferase PlsX